MGVTPVLVEWVDAAADGVGWCSIADLDTEPRLIRTVGFLLEQVIPKHTTVAQSMDDDQVDSVLHIPSGMIVRIIDLEVRS